MEYEDVTFARLVVRLERDLGASPNATTTPTSDSSITSGISLSSRAARSSGWFNFSGRGIRVGLVAAVVAVVAGVSLLIGVTGGGSQSGGATWRLVSSASSPFRSLSGAAVSQSFNQGSLQSQCVSNRVCYTPGASGSLGLYVTKDGGHTWKMTAPIPLDQNQGNLDPVCSTATTCVVLGTQVQASGSQVPSIAVTTDSGQQWHTLRSPPCTG